MTKYHKEQAERRYEIDGKICQVCRKRATQIAHRIPRTKINIKKYGEKIVNHNINLVPVCGLECNKKIDIGNIDKKIKEMVRIIEMNKNNRLEGYKITSLVKRFFEVKYG